MKTTLPTAASGRDDRIDFLRGLALLVMTVNHLDVKASLFYAFTGQGRFYISAAEGFYFLSGLVLGMVAVRMPLERLLRRVARRAGQLYSMAVGISLFFTLLGLAGLRLWYDFQKEIPAGGELWGFIGRMFTLQNSFHGGEFMALYVVLLAGALAALALMKMAPAARAAALVGLVSLGLYITGQAFPERAYLGLDTRFAPLNWQIFFYGGLLLGYYREGLAAWYGRLGLRPALEAVLLAVGIGFLWLHATGYAAWPGLPGMLGERESQMAPARLLLVGVYLADFFILTVHLWKWLRPALGWLLLPLGRSSLTAFFTHLLALVLIYNLPFFTRQPRLLAGTALHVLILGLVWGVCVLKGLWERGALTPARLRWGAAALHPYKDGKP